MALCTLRMHVNYIMLEGRKLSCMGQVCGSDGQAPAHVFLQEDLNGMGLACCQWLLKPGGLRCALPLAAAFQGC